MSLDSPKHCLWAASCSNITWISGTSVSLSEASFSHKCYYIGLPQLFLESMSWYYLHVNSHKVSEFRMIQMKPWTSCLPVVNVWHCIWTAAYLLSLCFRGPLLVYSPPTASSASPQCAGVITVPALWANSQRTRGGLDQ